MTRDPTWRSHRTFVYRPERQQVQTRVANLRFDPEAEKLVYDWTCRLCGKVTTARYAPGVGGKRTTTCAPCRRERDKVGKKRRDKTARERANARF